MTKVANILRCCHLAYSIYLLLIAVIKILMTAYLGGWKQKIK